MIAAGYDRYNGATKYADGHLVAEEPDGTVVLAVKEFALDLAVVDGGTWSSFPRADFTWGPLVALRRWDVRNVGVIKYGRPRCAGAVLSRYMERSRCSFQIPSDFRCDRTFLENTRDGVYVKEMYTWLFGGGTMMPVLTTDSIRNAVGGERGMR